MKGILTKREREVFELLITNLTTKEIADKLKYAEEQFAKHIKKEEDKKKKKIHITVEGDD